MSDCHCNSRVVVKVLLAEHAAECEHVEGGPLEAEVVARPAHLRQQQLVQQRFGDLWGWHYVLGGGAATCSEGFATYFLKVPLACLGSMAAAVQLNMGTFGKHFTKPPEQVATPTGRHNGYRLYRV